MNVVATILFPIGAVAIAIAFAAHVGHAVLLANGRAAADALTSLAEAYKGSGPAARDALLLQKLGPVFEQLTSTMRDIKIDRLTVLGRSGGGPAVGASIIGANEQIRAATGVDLVAAAKRIAAPQK